MNISELQKHFKDESYSLKDSIIAHTISALALHMQLQDKIDADFEKDKKTFYELFLKNECSYTPFFHLFPATDEVRMIKLSSMYVLYEKQESGLGRKLLLSFIKDGYKRVFDYVHQRSVLSIESLLAFYTERQKEPVAEPFQTLIAAVALFIGYPDKEIVKVSFDPVLKSVLYNMNYFDSAMKQNGPFAEEKKKHELTSLSSFQKAMGFKLGKNDLLDFIWSKHENHISKSLTKKEKNLLISKGDFQALYSKGLYKYWKPLTSLLRVNDINDMNFSLIPITRDDVNSIYTVFKTSQDIGRLEEDDFDFFLVSSLVILMMIKHYELLRKGYLDMFELSSGKEEIQLQSSWFEEKAILIGKQALLEKEIALLKEKTKAQEEEILELKREKRDNSFERNELQFLKKEVISLREYIFSKEEERNEFEHDVQNDAIEQLQKVKIAVIGGHQRWHQKIKETLPHIRTVHPDEMNIDLSFLRNMDLVLIETSYNNHTLYHKVLGMLKSSDVPVRYIHQQKNVEKLLDILKK